MNWWQYDIPWHERAPSTHRFNVRRGWFERHGMRAKVSMWEDTHEGHTLIGLRVEPLDRFMHAPPNALTPWHVSICYKPVRPALYEAFTREWGRPKIVRLQFHKIRPNAVADLSYYTDPIATNSVIKSMHAEDEYIWDRPLHISF